MGSLHVIILVFVAINLGYISGHSGEEAKKFYTGLLPLVMECSKEFGVAEDELKAAKESGSLGSLDPCLIACVFKKAKMINDQGLFDTEKAAEISKKYLSEDADLQKAEEIIKTCSSVNEESVNDGEKGCDRSKLLFDCLIPFKGEFNKSR